MARSKIRGHEIESLNGEWVYSDDKSSLVYTDEQAGSGQYGTCITCKKEPTKEGHDGCLGTLQDLSIMNACCGHGNDEMAYIQYWGHEKRSRRRISGEVALVEQKRLISKRDGG